VDIWFNYVDQVLIFVVFAVSLNVLLGYAGQVSVAHAAFGAVGGYTVAYLLKNDHWNFLAAALLGMLIAFVIGSLTSLPALRLSVEYLILLTLGLGFVLLGVASANNKLGGNYGLLQVPKPDLFGLHLDRPRDWVVMLALFAAVTFAICHRIGESAYGRVLKGIREEDQVAKALGTNVFGYRLSAFGLTAAMAAFAGGLYSAYLTVATPSTYGFDISLKVFAMVIFGGMANLWGSVVGAAVVVFTQPLLERQPFVNLDTRKASLLQLIIYGLLLVVLMRWRSQGVLPEGFRFWRWVLRRDRRTAAAARAEMTNEAWVPDIRVTHEPEVDERVREEEWRRAAPVLEVRGLSKRFGGITAADGLNMDLHKGSITALVGPNGAGKTTVFNLLTGFITPDAGSVVLEGEELVGRSPSHIARRGMVRTFQDVRVIPRLSCLENVMLAVQDQAGEHLRKLFFSPAAVRAAEEHSHEKALEWLRFVGMEAFASVPGGAVSYGQSKLVSLARALATEANVLLLDEPASGVDTKWIDALLDLVLQVKQQGRTVCIVEHNLHVVERLADHTYFMELGVITAQGTIDELTRSPRLAEAYFGTTVAA
jgi:branched-chain amino acid transport system permease protein